MFKCWRHGIQASRLDPKSTYEYEVLQNFFIHNEQTQRDRESLHSLKEKGLIEETDVKRYRGREYSQFWLTERGVIEAVIEEVPSHMLFEKTKEIYPENYVLHCLLEIAQNLALTCSR